MPSRSLGRASLLLLGSTWAHSGLSLVASILVGRVLGPEAIGAIALNLGLAGLVMAAMLPGFAQAHLKRLAEGQDTGRCLGTMTALQGALALLLLAVLGGVWLLGPPTGGVLDHPVLAFMLGAQIIGRFADVFLRVFLNHQWVIAHGAIVLAARTLRLALTIAVLALVPRVEWVALTFVVESVVTCLAAAVTLWVLGIRPRMPTRESVRMYWDYARPFLVTTPIALVQDSLDRFLVGRLAGLAAAGYYHVARGLWEVLSSTLAPPSMFLLTRLSSLYFDRSERGDHEARALFYRGLDKTLFATTPLALAFWILSEPIIATLYGEAFSAAALSTRILVVAALAANLVNPYLAIVLAQDRTARLIPVNIVRLVAYTLMLVILVSGTVVPWLPGDAGAAVTRVFVIVFPAWVYFRWTSELAGVRFYWRSLVYLAGFATGVLLYHLTIALGAQAWPESAWLPVTGALAAAAGYAGVLLKFHPGIAETAGAAMDLVFPPGVRARFRREPRPR